MKVLPAMQKENLRNVQGCPKDTRLHDCAQVGIGLECGVGCDGFTEWKEGDIIDAFMVKEKRRTLEEASIMGSLDADDV